MAHPSFAAFAVTSTSKPKPLDTITMLRMISPRKAL
jgi:hypothetical protein